MLGEPPSSRSQLVADYRDALKDADASPYYIMLVCEICGDGDQLDKQETLARIDSLLNDLQVIRSAVVDKPEKPAKPPRKRTRA